MKCLPAALVLLVAGGLLSACGEKPQSADATARKSDEKAWQQPADKSQVVPGLKADDKAAWEAQMRQRAQGQNEYSRAATNPGA